MAQMETMQNPLKIGDLTLHNRLMLAPLAGVSDIPFRRICQELGAGLTYVEMLSATALVHGSKKTFDMLKRHPAEKTLGVQVTGGTPEVVEKACKILWKEGFDAVDLNMGCPVKKIVSAGCGSAIMRDPQRVTDTLEACRSLSTKPLSAKIRLGYTRDELNVTDIANRIARAQCDQITIHGRTRSENYAVPVDLAGIRVGFTAARRENPNIICVSNGDLFHPSDLNNHLKNADPDAVMVSRGALGNPWIFEFLLGKRKNEPTAEEWSSVVLRHLEYHLDHYGDTKLAALLMRKHLLWYIKGYPGAKSFRERAGQIESIAEAMKEVRRFAGILPRGIRRYATELPVQNQNESESAQARMHDPKFEMNRDLDRGVGDDGISLISATP